MTVTLQPQLAESLAKSIRTFRRDPVLFVRRVIGANPTPDQERILRAAAKPGSRVTVRAGHGVGKTAVLAWLIIWFICLFPESVIPCTAGTASQLSSVLWSEISRWHAKMIDGWRDMITVTASKVTLRGQEQTTFAIARTARPENPDALQGFHAENILFVIDEASGVHDKIFEVAKGAMSTTGARAILIANPTKNSGYFHRTHNALRDNWTCLHISSVGNPLVSKTYAKEMAVEYGEDSDVYRVRVLGEFPRADVVQMIPTDLVEAAMARVANPRAFMHLPVCIGVDVARFGDDRTVFIKRQGPAVTVLNVIRNRDLMQTASLAAQYADTHNSQLIFVDDCGVGGGVTDRLRQLGRNVAAVNSGNVPRDPSKFANLRAEMWHELKLWLADGAYLPADEALKADLTAPEYFFNAKDRIQLESKDGLKKRGLHSPDLADALALTFAYGRHGVPMRTELEKASGNQQFCRKDYDPLS